MDRLILHIGTHKTGSTAIQHWLADHRAALCRRSVHYGSTDRPPHPKLPKHNSLYRSLINPRGDFQFEKAAILSDFEKSGCHTLILSEEGLSEPYYNRLRQIAELRDHFEIDVICFLRRQDHFLESLWNQRCREGLETRPIDEFVAQDHSSRLADYAEKLAFWSEIGTVQAVAYAEMSHAAVETFARLAGLDHEEARTVANFSPSMNCAACCNLLNRLGIRYDREWMIDKFERDSRRYALGRKLRREVLERYASTNATLARRYGIVFDTTMPLEPARPLRWPELPVVLGAALGGWRRGRAA